MEQLYQWSSDHYYRRYRQCDRTGTALRWQLWVQRFGMVYYMYMACQYRAGRTYTQCCGPCQWNNHMCQLWQCNSHRQCRKRR